MKVILTRSLRPFVFKNVYSSWLNYDNLDSLGLYVHIPFCRRICGFCPYCKVVYDRALAAEYKAALLSEIELAAAGHEKKRVTSLYFGGGTPALMLDDLKDIIDCLKNYYDIHGGIGVELHPDDIDENLLVKLKNADISMVSIGVQSFHADCLKRLGRRQTDVTDKLKLVKSLGFDVIDVDLIFAIPGQNTETLLHDMETAFQCGATQISTYPFIDFTFADNLYKPMPEKVKKQMLAEIARFAKRSGIRRTSVWTFAKEGTKKYSSVTRNQFLGFGVSATTLLQNEFKINTFSIPAYIERIRKKQLPTSMTLGFTHRQRACYYLFWCAYAMQLDDAEFMHMFGVPIAKIFGPELWLCERLGFLRRKNGTYRLTDKGAYYYHYLEQAYTTAYIDKMWNVLRTQPFPKRIVL